jgi:hypothetical protein
MRMIEVSVEFNEDVPERVLEDMEQHDWRVLRHARPSAHSICGPGWLQETKWVRLLIEGTYVREVRMREVNWTQV